MCVPNLRSVGPRVQHAECKQTDTQTDATEATLSIFYGQQVLRHVQIVSDKKKKSSILAFIFIFPPTCQEKMASFNTIGI